MSHSYIHMRFAVALCLIIPLLSCTKEATNPDDASGSSTQLNISALRQDANGASSSLSGSMRLISTEGDNALSTATDGQYSFTLRHGNTRQTLYFLNGFADADVSSLSAAQLNGQMLNTADYFKNQGGELDLTRDPNLYFGSVSKEVNTPLSSITLSRTYAKVTAQISPKELPNDGASVIRTPMIAEVSVEYVPSKFSIGGMKTAYLESADTPYTRFVLFSRGANISDTDAGYGSYSFYLPEHDPKEPLTYTKLRVTIRPATDDSGNSGTIAPTPLPYYEALIVEPYASVDDGKIVRGKHYRVNFKVPIIIPSTDI